MQKHMTGFSGSKHCVQCYTDGGTVKHPGFKAVEAKIAKEPGVRNPGAVLAAAARNASPAAKRANPRLKRVSGA